MQVYCTDCEHFRLCDENIPYCIYENQCCIKNCEDSKDIAIRPKYEVRQHKVEYINPKEKQGMKTSMEDKRLIKVTHIESGMSVTKHSRKSHLEAKELAKKELNDLVKIWEG